MTRIIQKIIFALLLAIFVFLPATPFTYAQTCPDDKEGYCLLEPIFADQVNKRVDMAGYLKSIYDVFFITAGILATLMLIWGGFQYMTSEIPGMKGKGIEQMQHAIWGLLLAFGSFLILNTINPDLTKINFNLRPIPNLKGGADTTTNPTGPTPTSGPWPDDSATRQSMQNSVPGLTFNRTNDCDFIGEQECTSVFGISSAVTSGIAQLQKACNCQIMLNGATEYWLHGNKSTDLNSNPTDHRPGGRAVDLNDSGALSTFIRQKGASITARGCSELGPKFKYNGATYVDEGNHWHVCY